jgi:mRNA interferase RelE/StbE
VSYAIQYHSSALRELKKLDRPIRLKIEAAIVDLAEDPRPHGCAKLVNSQAWRIRVGDYRVVYDIVDRKLVVMIVRVRHRRDVYE